jgi:GNAT superfamily N-acetyltransferase
MYEIVRYCPELKPQVAALQRHLWRGSEAENRAYFEWKYERNPYIASPLVYLAVCEGRVVGMRGMFGACWEIGPRSERFVVPCADDFVIAPEHRNRGLFGRIMSAAWEDLAARGHRCAFSLSAGDVTLAGSLVSGWRSIGSALEVQRKGIPSAPWRDRVGARLRSMPLLWRWADAVAGRVDETGRRPFRRLDRPARRSPDATTVWLAREPKPTPMAELIRRLGHDGRVRHARDEEYLGWRFANPLHEYRFLFSGDRRMDGYLVLQSYRLDRSRGVNIVDWEAETPSVRSALLRAALDWGRFAEVSAWTVTLPEAARALLGESGFAPATRGRLTRRGPHLLVRGIGDPRSGTEPLLGTHRLLDVSGWDMRMLYSMAA